MAWFDDHKNNVGALCTRLATDSSNVQGVGFIDGNIFVIYYYIIVPGQPSYCLYQPNLNKKVIIIIFKQFFNIGMVFSYNISVIIMTCQCSQFSHYKM